jgi:hypothetical protein
VLGQSVQESSEVLMLQVKEEPISWAQEALVMQVQDESGASLLQGVPAQVEPVADDMPLGADGVEVDRADS